jgi:hypothetical protein
LGQFLIKYSVRQYPSPSCCHCSATDRRATPQPKLQRPTCANLDLRYLQRAGYHGWMGTDLVASGRIAGRLSILDQCEITSKTKVSLILLWR